MTTFTHTDEKPIQTLRRRLDAICRRQRASRYQAHEFAMRRLEAKLVSRKKTGTFREGLGTCSKTTSGFEDRFTPDSRSKVRS